MHSLLTDLTLSETKSLEKQRNRLYIQYQFRVWIRVPVGYFEEIRGKNNMQVNL
jgi:hypothetical protein